MTLYPHLCLLLLTGATAAAIVWLRSQHARPSSPEELDITLTPPELGYLIDGQQGFVRAMLDSMARKGWLERRDEHHMLGITPYYTPATHPPPSSLLQSAEHELWLFITPLSGPRSLTSLLSSSGLAGALHLFGEQIHRELAHARLMHPLEVCKRHDDTRRAVSFGIVTLGLLLAAGLLTSSTTAATLLLALTTAAWFALNNLTAHPLRTPHGERFIDVYHDLYAPMNRRRDTWRRFAPRDLDYLSVIFSRT